MLPMADRISTLPDSILCHILSFLPTKQAVATSVLSKRWRPLWLSVPTLDFNDRSYLQNKETYFRFLQSVYIVMLLRDGAQPIKRFYLKCVSSFCDPSIVNTWVIAATHREVEHLSLLLPSTINLPSCILTSRTLVVLKLRGLTVESLCSVSFPSLKILHLRKVHFLERGYLIEILSACPVLEVLLMKFLKVTNFLTGGQLIHLPKLVKADISKSSIQFPLIGIYNVEFLRAEVIFPSVVHTFFNLTCMELSFLHYYWDWLIDLLYYCPRLQNLVIDKMEGNTYSRQSDDEDEAWLHPQVVPECLSSQLKRFCVRKYGGQESELQFTKYIMHNAGVLRTVKICCTRSSNPLEKLEMIKKLSLCPRSSVTCELYFE